MKKSIISGITQLFLIVFSVVLGIFLSERIEERKNKREASLLLSKLKSEVVDNQKILTKWVPYHVEIVKGLDSLGKNEPFIKEFIEDKTVLFEKILTQGKLMSEFPSSNAWDIAKSHPLIVHFDYEDLLILSKVYNQQTLTYEAVPNMIQLLLSAEFNSKGNAKSNLQSFKNQMREITSREIQLMNYFQEAQSILELSSN